MEIASDRALRTRTAYRDAKQDSYCLFRSSRPESYVVVTVLADAPDGAYLTTVALTVHLTARNGRWTTPESRWTHVSQQLSILDAAASSQTIRVSESAESRLIGPATPRRRMPARDFQEHSLRPDQPPPDTRCTTAPTAPPPGAACQLQYRNARRFRKNRPEFGAALTQRRVEPSIHDSSQRLPTPWQSCSRPPPARLRFFRSRCSPSLAFCLAQPVLSLICPEKLPDQFVSYNLSSPRCISCHGGERSRMDGCCSGMTFADRAASGALRWGRSTGPAASPTSVIRHFHRHFTLARLEPARIRKRREFWSFSGQS